MESLPKLNSRPKQTIDNRRFRGKRHPCQDLLFVRRYCGQRSVAVQLVQPLQQQFLLLRLQYREQRPVAVQLVQPSQQQLLFLRLQIKGWNFNFVSFLPLLWPAIHVVPALAASCSFLFASTNTHRNIQSCRNGGRSVLSKPSHHHQTRASHPTATES
jgi:hypothetical protein